MDKPFDTKEHLAGQPVVSQVDFLRPLHWLSLGWKDFMANPGASVAQGAILVAIGWLILLLCSAQINLLAAAISGFLLVGPVFGAGFYELSRRRAAGQAATLDAALEGAVLRRKPLARLGGILAVLAVAWVVVSSTLFAHSTGGAPPPLDETFYSTVVDWSSSGFLVTYLGTGAPFAFAAFLLSAVSAPMIFDRDISVRNAMLTSLRVVAANPATMLLWAGLIAALTAIGFATFLFGLIIVLPWLGHATWHAYRDLVK